MGIEPTTLGTTTRCSNQLSYTHQNTIYKWSGRKDSNLRPPGPKPGALTRLRYAPNNKLVISRMEFYTNFTFLSRLIPCFKDLFLIIHLQQRLEVIHTLNDVSFFHNHLSSCYCFFGSIFVLLSSLHQALH